MSKSASAYTTERVTGNMQVVDWSKMSTKWEHLQGIKFPLAGPRPIVDLLDGRYTVGMPWKRNKCSLPNNYSLALH